VRYRDATVSAFVAKVVGEVFAYFQAVALKRHSSMRKWLFGQTGIIIYEEHPLRQRKPRTCSWLCSWPVSPFQSRWVWTSLVRPILSSPNACLIIGRVSIARFPRVAQNLMLFLCRINREIASGQIKGGENLSCVKFCTWVPIFASTTIYNCIALLQLLFRWRHQSRKLWMPRQIIQRID
jgi:hypothetical protein